MLLLTMSYLLMLSGPRQATLASIPLVSAATSLCRQGCSAGASTGAARAATAGITETYGRSDNILCGGLPLPRDRGCDAGGPQQEERILQLVASKVGTYSLSIYLSRLGCSLGELPLLGLTNFVSPKKWKTQKNCTSSYR